MLKKFFLISLVGLMSMHMVHAGDFVAQLVYCFNEPPAQKEDSRISKAVMATIDKTFGYRYARVAQQATSPLQKTKSDFPPLGKDFSLKIEQLEHKGDIYKLRVNFWHKDKSIVETVVNFERGTPLYIKGPLYDKGLLLLVIQVDDQKSE
ncbi:MAG: hypothetical protein SGI98_10170 [Verrucomicrobiota bacterium]|nr:hypothetical protein [Verrucomicrobiota bacterium]